ncbi:unnamed protein product [Parnassius apollo]|uniref:(apollo) hypothetical protein n=1 Tax=Parnassius apollo TaxID=110799 RepID=A0A8S3W235_PARAO|nr:unnamed protein product [Parnassius apollo]
MNELEKNSGTDTLMNLWLARLLAWVRVILAINRAETKLDDLTERADKVTDNLGNGELFTVDAGSDCSSSLTSTVAEVNFKLLTQVKTMALELQTLRSKMFTRSEYYIFIFFFSLRCQ